jgi:hypothetical protein
VIGVGGGGASATLLHAVRRMAGKISQADRQRIEKRFKINQ